MRSKWMPALLITLAPLVALLAPAQTRTPSVQAQEAIEVLFSPKGGCTEAIVGELRQAKAIIRIQAYSFTFTPIAKPSSRPRVVA